MQTVTVIGTWKKETKLHEALKEKITCWKGNDDQTGEWPFQIKRERERERVSECECDWQWLPNGHLFSKLTF
jgi:hypothetical protein